MLVLENFKNIPRSSTHRATGPKCNFFFFKFATKSLEKKKGACRPPNGRQAPVAHPRGDQQPTGARGAGRPSCGRQGGLGWATGLGRLYKASPSLPPLI